VWKRSEGSLRRKVLLEDISKQSKGSEATAAKASTEGYEAKD
jgi:hypothetical protein